jgi:ABC-type transport system substrate-binding protein
VRVRQALDFATDKQGFVDKVTHGVDTIGDSDQPSFLWAHNDHLKQYPYDPQRASALLDLAGWKRSADGWRYKNGQRLSLQAAGTSGSHIDRAIFALLQDQWKNAGVELTEKAYAPSILLASYGEGGIVQTGKFDVGFYSWINGVDPDDSTQYMCDQFPPNGQNAVRYCSKAVDAAERAALAEYDQLARKAAYDAIQEHLVEDVPVIVLWYTRRLDVFNTDFKGYKPAHAVSEFWNTWEWSI